MPREPKLVKTWFWMLLGAWPFLFQCQWCVLNRSSKEVLHNQFTLKSLGRNKLIMQEFTKNKIYVCLSIKSQMYSSTHLASFSLSSWSSRSRLSLKCVQISSFVYFEESCYEAQNLISRLIQGKWLSNTAAADKSLECLLDESYIRRKSGGKTFLFKMFNQITAKKQKHVGFWQHTFRMWYFYFCAWLPH